MCQEPVARVLDHRIERARLLEEMRRAGNDREPLCAAQFVESRAIEAKHNIVVTTDDQEGGGADRGQCPPGEVRAAAARHDRRDPHAFGRRGDERRRAPVFAPK